MGLFGKSFEEQVAEAVKAIAGTIHGLRSLAATVDGKTVTLTGEADSVEAKGKAMAEFNAAVETENTFNKIRLTATPATAAAATAVAPEPPADAEPEERIHVVEKGESLSVIAKHYYGRAGLYTKIFEANRDVLSNPDLIKPGQRLRIPD